MRSLYLLLLVSGMIVVGGLSWLFWPEHPRPALPESKALQQRSVTGFQGVASCSAAACHGNGNPGSWGGEATTWALSDPHARAYAVLLEERSKQIERRLHPGIIAPKPEEHQLCLNCHVQPGISRADKSPQFRLQDGVGCESCHGQADKWVHEHWKAQHPDRQALGMVDTRNLQVRAEACVKCHVGQGDMEVNHDLIAAGHPRLRFEFAAYLANYPRHWREDKDRQRYPDLEMQAWKVGQSVCAEASLRLLAHRAGTSGKTWPEFAEHDCYACHHHLIPDGWRQKDLVGKTRLGTLVLNDWYYAALPVVAKGFDIAPLAKQMNKRNPDRVAVAGQATKLADQLARERKTSLGGAGGSELLRGLAEEESRRVRPGWDRATQLYLGAAAATANGGDRENLRKEVAALGDLLGQAFLDARGAALDSPHGYGTQAVRQRWAEIREQLKQVP